MSYLTVRIGPVVLRWDDGACSWRDKAGRFCPSPLTPEGQRKLFEQMCIRPRRKRGKQ